MKCEDCGGPVVQLFTGVACKNECDLHPDKVVVERVNVAEGTIDVNTTARSVAPCFSLAYAGPETVTWQQLNQWWNELFLGEFG